MDRIEKKASEISDHVPLKFSSEANYKKKWDKLFFEEAKAQILKSHQN